jgi:protein-disulfide isomerase
MEKVTDIADILEFGVAGTPGLVINDKVVSVGKIPSLEETKDLISKAL